MLPHDATSFDLPLPVLARIGQAKTEPTFAIILVTHIALNANAASVYSARGDGTWATLPSPSTWLNMSLVARAMFPSTHVSIRYLSQYTKTSQPKRKSTKKIGSTRHATSNLCFGTMYMQCSTFSSSLQCPSSSLQPRKTQSRGLGT
jgi:hypothetical protein